MKNQSAIEEKRDVVSVRISDFMLFMVDLFKENDIICQVTAADELTVSDEGWSFLLKISER